MTPGMHRYSRMERVIYGRSVREVLPEELKTACRHRVFLVTNRSLAGTAEVAGIVEALGSDFAGRYDGVRAHAPRECVVEGAAAARAAGADLLLAVGGGSVIDAAKAMLLCLRHGYAEPAQLDPHANARVPDLGSVPADADQWLRVIAVPTTLSGAEFTSSAGATDMRRGMKEAFSHPMLMPQSVILDPHMTLTAPLPLLLATGMKAVDHAVERITSARSNPYSDTVSALALRLLGQALSAVRERPEDLQLRLELQYGVFMSFAGAAAGVNVNVSHAIGHVLGAHAQVPHGETSCTVLPSVLRWNAKETAQQQWLVCEALGKREGEAAHAVADLVAALGLPGRLRDVGVGRADLAVMAEKTMHEALIRNSRKPVRSASDIQEILEAAW